MLDWLFKRHRKPLLRPEANAAPLDPTLAEAHKEISSFIDERGIEIKQRASAITILATAMVEQYGTSR